MCHGYILMCTPGKLGSKRERELYKRIWWRGFQPLFFLITNFNLLHVGLSYVWLDKQWQHQNFVHEFVKSVLTFYSAPVKYELNLWCYFTIFFLPYRTSLSGTWFMSYFYNHNPCCTIDDESLMIKASIYNLICRRGGTMTLRKNPKEFFWIWGTVCGGV